LVQTLRTELFPVPFILVRMKTVTQDSVANSYKAKRKFGTDLASIQTLKPDFLSVCSW